MACPLGLQLIGRLLTDHLLRAAQAD